MDALDLHVVDAATARDVLHPIWRHDASNGDPPAAAVAQWRRQRLTMTLGS